MTKQLCVSQFIISKYWPPHARSYTKLFTWSFLWVWMSEKVSYFKRISPARLWLIMCFAVTAVKRQRDLIPCDSCPVIKSWEETLHSLWKINTRVLYHNSGWKQKAGNVPHSTTQSCHFQSRALFNFASSSWVKSSCYVCTQILYGCLAWAAVQEENHKIKGFCLHPCISGGLPSRLTQKNETTCCCGSRWFVFSQSDVLSVGRLLTVKGKSWWESLF